MPGMHGMVIVDVDGQVAADDFVVLHTAYTGQVALQPDLLPRVICFVDELHAMLHLPVQAGVLLGLSS